MPEFNPTDVRSKETIVNRNVAVYFALASFTPTITLHAAVVRDLLRRGNKVTVYVCDGSFRSPTDNPFNRRSIQRFQMFRARDAVQGLPVRFKVINLRDIPEEVPERIADALATGAMSSYASLVKAQTKEELGREWLRAHDNMLRSAKKLYNYFMDEARAESFDFLFTFNARFGDARPVVEAARDLGIGFGLYDIKRGINEVVYVNELIHSIAGGTRRALAAYEADTAGAIATAKKFFEKKVRREGTGDPVFTGMQERGSLPEGVAETAKKVIAVYPTTEDEYKFLGKEWDGRIPESQVDEIEELAKGLPPERYLLVVKMHPNQARTAEHVIEKYLALAKEHPHVIVEMPLSKKDTYALMRRADIVVAFASTAGVEACYAGKPVILIGDTDWGSLNIAYKVYTGADAAELILKGVEPKPILGAIIWGNYLYAQKDRLPGLEIREGGDFSVDGRKIGKSTFLRTLQMPARLEIYVKSPGFSLGSLLSRIIGTGMSIIKGK
jgi:hypothetical protein